MKRKDALIDFYKIIPKKMKTSYHNPNFKKHLMNIPFRAVICGNSGSGKSTLVLEIIHRFSDTFGNITLCTKNADEPLYKFLRSKIPENQLQIFEGYENIPPLDMLNPDYQHLVIFDDLVLEKDQSTIEQYYIRSRKIAKGVSCIYCSQSYFRIPKTIRLQCNYILLKKLSSIRDLNLVMSDFSLGALKEQLVDIYKHCIQDPRDFLMIDIDSPPERRFRLNFLNIFSLT